MVTRIEIVYTDETKKMSLSVPKMNYSHKKMVEQLKEYEQEMFA